MQPVRIEGPLNGRSPPEIALIVDTETPYWPRGIITREWLGASAALASYRPRFNLPKSRLIPWRSEAEASDLLRVTLYPGHFCGSYSIHAVGFEPGTWYSFDWIPTDRVRLCDSYLDIVELINFLRWLRGLDLWLSMRRRLKMRPNWGKVDGSRLNFGRIFFPRHINFHVNRFQSQNRWLKIYSLYFYRILIGIIYNIEAKCPIVDITMLKKIDNTGNVDCTQVIRALTKEVTKMISVQLKS